MTGGADLLPLCVCLQLFRCPAAGTCIGRFRMRYRIMVDRCVLGVMMDRCVLGIVMDCRVFGVMVDCLVACVVVDCINLDAFSMIPSATIISNMKRHIPSIL